MELAEGVVEQLVDGVVSAVEDRSVRQGDKTQLRRYLNHKKTRKHQAHIAPLDEHPSTGGTE